MSTPVTVVCGPDRDPAMLIACGRRGADPTRVLLEHDLTQVDLGLVGRASDRGGGRYEAEVVELAHGCVSGTVREDALPTLVAPATSGTVEHVVLLLPDVVEAASFLEALHGMALPRVGGTSGGGTAAEYCHVETVVAVVRATDLVPTVVAGQTLTELGRTAADADERSRGTIRLAGHPDALVGWEAAGPRLSLGHVGTWLDGEDSCAWDHADPHRRVRAQLNWDATFGDRYQVAVTGVGDLTDVAGLLDACLVTEAELRAGLGSGPLPTDPFADVFTHSQEAA